MYKYFRNSFVLLLTAVGLFLLIAIAPAAASPQSVTVPSAPVPEAQDYATLAWGDPWDMSEYSDVSQYINESGERDVVRNINVSNGVFSGTSSGSHMAAQNGWFFTLFPGYQTTIHAGKVGSFKPVSSSEYKCLYIAMNVASGGSFRVFWFANDRLNTPGGVYGLAQGMSATSSIWKLYKVELSNRSLTPDGFTPWSDNPTWQGLRIDPTMEGGVNYSVDWVRLTDCSPQTTNITFSSNSNITAVWLRPQGTNRYIQVATNVNGSSGSYNLDVQGIQPGKYYVGFGTNSSCCITESTTLLTINQTPIVHFAAPTFYSGEDYATSAGNAWDMSSPEDYTDVTCATYGHASDSLWLDTPSNTVQPAECVGGPPQYVADPNVILNTPAPANPAEYRYLTFRIYEGNPWQYVAQGSITRWIWAVQGNGGLCYLVSQDIPHDVGWHTYTVDLWDAFAGSAEGWAGKCDNLSLNWRQSTSVLRMRFDPNENITDHSFRNEIDWIRLTKPIVISRGEVYRLGLNEFFPNDTFNVSLFYTTDPKNQPTQHAVVQYMPPAPSTAGPFTVFLPAVTNGVEDSMIGADLEYQWDTASVAPGEYYICVRVFDSYNQAVFCSEATITIQ